MKLRRKTFLFVSVAALVLLGCSTTKRGEIVAVRDWPSPDHRYVCSVYGETFHDTTGYRQHVSLRPSGQPRSFPGNVYVAPVGDHVKIMWISPTNLSVQLSFETGKRIPADRTVCGVAVRFSEISK